METASENCSGEGCTEGEREIWWELGARVWSREGEFKDGKEFRTVSKLGRRVSSGKRSRHRKRRSVLGDSEADRWTRGEGRAE